MSAIRDKIARVARRCITVPSYLIAAAFVVPLACVVGLPIAALTDTVRHNRWAWSRGLCFVCVYFLCEAAGILIAFALWIAHLVVPSFGAGPYLRANFRLQCAWASTLFGSLRRMFALSVRVTGAEVLTPGPILLLPRHVSTADTLLPAAFVSAPNAMVLRYVLKRELLWDPCLDIVGHRLRNYFVDRASRNTKREVEAVADLADGIGDSEGVLIYPEGTRFTPAKLRHAIDRITGNEESPHLAIAKTYRHVLPPRTAGPVALIQRNIATDVVICAHSGFEAMHALSHVFNGSLIDRAISIEFWRFRRADLPGSAGELGMWLMQTWQRVDEWVARQVEEPTPCAS